MYKIILIIVILLITGCGLVSRPADPISEIKGTEIDNIRIKNDLWNFFNHNNLIIGNTLYINKNIWLFHSKISLESTIRHECIHARRQAELGVFKWVLYYVLSKDFRFKEECLAYEEEIKFLIENGYKINPKWFIETLSGPDYLWMADAEKVANWVVETIIKLKTSQRNDLSIQQDF